MRIIRNSLIEIFVKMKTNEFLFLLFSTSEDRKTVELMHRGALNKMNMIEVFETLEIINELTGRENKDKNTYEFFFSSFQRGKKERKRRQVTQDERKDRDRRRLRRNNREEN